MYDKDWRTVHICTLTKEKISNVIGSCSLFACFSASLIGFYKILQQKHNVKYIYYLIDVWRRSHRKTQVKQQEYTAKK